jgi:hypothetical protein
MDLAVSNISVVSGNEFVLDNVSFPLTIPPGGRADLGVTFWASHLPSTGSSGEFEIVSDDPRTPLVRLKMLGRSSGKRIEVIPEYINLGLRQSDHNFTAEIKSRGSEPVTVSELRFHTGQIFSVTNPPLLPMAIPAGQSRLLTLHFSLPSAPGVYEDKLYVANDDPHPYRKTFEVGLRVEVQ